MGPPHHKHNQIYQQQSNWSIRRIGSWGVVFSLISYLAFLQFVSDPQLSNNTNVIQNFSEFSSTSKMTALSHAIIKQRSAAAIIGGFVADAATMGLHWIYDQDKLNNLVKSATYPEFFTPPSCPFYEYPSGALSPYGDEIIPLLQDVATRGDFDAKEFAMTSYHAAKEYKGRLNHIMKEMIVKGDEGKVYPDLASESADLQGAAKVPILLANYIKKTSKTSEASVLNVEPLLTTVKEATRVHQIGDLAEGGAILTALLLHRLVTTSTSINEAIRSLQEDNHLSSEMKSIVKDVVDSVDSNTYDSATAASAKFGKSCPQPGSMKTLLYVLLTTNSYTEAVRANMVAGGDNASRSVVIGACMTAFHVNDESSSGGVPDEWKSKTTRFSEIESLVQKIVN